MCWGVDDFDESYPLPYTNDLVRLATSVKLEVDVEGLTIKFKQGCDAILEGYRQTLRTEGCPFVLAEGQQTLEKLGIDAIKPPDDFWPKLNRRPVVTDGLFPPLPARDRENVARSQARIQNRPPGSRSRQLGPAAFRGHCQMVRSVYRPRSQSHHSFFMRVAERQSRPLPNLLRKAIESAVRSPDPYQEMVGTWLIRRLSPDANPIEIEDLPKKRDE